MVWSIPLSRGGGQLKPSTSDVYEFLIDQTTDDPASMISYTGANKNFVPAKMNFAAGKFDYGSWKDTWIMEKFKPCMLHANGTVAYYLNPHNLTQKITGGDAMSDLTSDSHDMNAMVEVGQIWIKEEVVDDDHFHIYLSPVKADGFDCWTHYNINNKLVNNYYVAMFSGVLDSTNKKVRSLIRRTPRQGVLLQTLREYCQANGSGWDCHEWSFQRLMQYVMLLIGKTTNVQNQFGNGACKTANGAPIVTGGYEVFGWFYGQHDELDRHCTVFGIEDLWGNVRGLTCGQIASGETNLYVKMTPSTADGSTGTSYSNNLNDYVAIPRPCGSAVCTGLVKKMKLIPGKGLFPSTFVSVDGTQSQCNTNYCDIAHVYNSASHWWLTYSGDVNDQYGSGIFSGFFKDKMEDSLSGEHGISLSYKSPN